MKKIIFSDIDGTLAHYPQHFKGFGEIVSKYPNSGTAIYRDIPSKQRRVCNILPSSAGMGNAYISHKTIEYVHKLRDKGMLFAVVSGMRKSTYLMRKPFLPEHDIAMVENGGIIFEGEQIDFDWFKKFKEVTGPIEVNQQYREENEKLKSGDRTKNFENIPTKEVLPPEKREGLLWDLYRKLKNDGWEVDARGYSTCIRVHLEGSKGKTDADVEAIRAKLPREITSSTNLGKIDFYPSVSGKGNAVRYILQKKDIKKEESIALFDDNNDLPMAEEVGLSMLPYVSHSSVEEALKKHPEWISSKQKGILGIEELLWGIMKKTA